VIGMPERLWKSSWRRWTQTVGTLPLSAKVTYGRLQQKETDGIGHVDF